MFGRTGVALDVLDSKMTVVKVMVVHCSILESNNKQMSKNAGVLAAVDFHYDTIAEHKGYIFALYVCALKSFMLLIAVALHVLT